MSTYEQFANFFKANSSGAALAAQNTGAGDAFTATGPVSITGALTVSTTINKVTVTAPATGSTLTIADGKTLTASNTLTLAGTDGTTMTFPAVSAAVGYLGIPSNSKSTDYTAVLADAGTSIDHPSTDANTRTFTIPANGSVAYAIGTCLTFTNMAAQTVTIAITTDTLNLAGTGTAGSRTLAQYGIATARKMTSTVWLISGVGLT